MGRLILSIGVAMILVGCVAPDRSQPGAVLTGNDVPPVVDLATSSLSKPPRPLKMMNPTYPLHLRQAGIAGVVQIQFIVGTDGRVESSQSISAPHPLLARAAEEAIRQSVFEPAEKAGRKVRCRLQTTLTFALD